LKKSVKSIEKSFLKSQQSFSFDFIIFIKKEKHELSLELRIKWHDTSARSRRILRRIKAKISERQSVARTSGCLFWAEVLKRVPTRDRAPPGAVKEGFSHGGVGPNYVQHEGIQRLRYSLARKSATPEGAFYCAKYSRDGIPYLIADSLRLRKPQKLS